MGEFSRNLTDGSTIIGAHWFGYPVVTVTGEDSDGARIAHGTAINTKNADRWKQVWTYLLSDKAQ